ncbi:MAG: ABC transporter ATP-binding protein [Xanthobacteraceae bacterium]
MLEVRELVVSYGHIEALRGVSLRVDAGEFVGVIGANGAGKSSLLAAVSGGVPVRSGRVLLEGEDITALPQHRRILKGMAIVPEGRQLFGPLSVLENLEIGAFHRRRDGAGAIHADLERVFALFPILHQRSQQLAATLSGGEQQMLAIGRALMSRPRLLILDEPSLGLAPVIFAEILARLRTLNAEGLTCLMVEQDVQVTLGVTRRSYVLSTGRVLAEGSSEDLQVNGLTEEIYFGMHAEETA